MILLTCYFSLKSVSVVTAMMRQLTFRYLRKSNIAGAGLPVRGS